MITNQLSADETAELLGNYIKRGFEAKTEAKLDLAVRVFSEALELNPPKDLELMLSFDIFAMLRELGQYDKARDVLGRLEKKSFPELNHSEAVEIKASLKHLDLIQEMLLKANTPNLPFSKVPALIKISAEEKINEWKNDTL